MNDWNEAELILEDTQPVSVPDLLADEERREAEQLRAIGRSWELREADRR
ncbi:MAG: hypothetical protein ACYCZK_01230 [Microbacteriaceae bacterium]